MTKTGNNVSAERYSRSVFYGLVAFSAVSFAAFWFLGQDTMTDYLLGIMYGLLFMAVGLTAVSVVRSIKMRSRGNGVVNGIPSTRIALGVALAVALLLLLTFGLGSGDTLYINGTPYADAFWLRTSDMLINTSVVLIAVAFAAVAFGMTGWQRKLKNGR